MKFPYKSLLATLLLSTSLFAQDASVKYDSEYIANLIYKLFNDPNDPKKKINHTKGFCALGEFIPNKAVAKNFDIPILKEKSIPALVRFSSGGGNPKISDKVKGRGMAIKLESKSDSWQMVMTNGEIMFAKNVPEFVQFFEIRIPQNGKVDEKKISKITQEVDSFRNFDKYQKTIGIPVSVGDATYHSTHTFFFKSAKGELVSARFKFVPVNGDKNLSQTELEKLGDDFLESNFQKDIVKKPMEFKMILVIANKNDPIDDITAKWEGKHQEVEIAKLSVKKYDGHGCNKEVFMPNILAEGIEPPKDPLFDIRNEVYSITFSRRL